MPPKKNRKKKGSKKSQAEWEMKKECGNASFSSENYVKAEVDYTKALDLIEEEISSFSAKHAIEGDEEETNCMKEQMVQLCKARARLFANRSAARAALAGLWADLARQALTGKGEEREAQARAAAEGAAADAARAREADPGWAKAYFRHGVALRAAGRPGEAAAALRAGLERCAEDDTGPLLRLLDELAGELEVARIADEQLVQNPEQDRFDALVSWLRAGGARFPDLFLQRYSEDNRGVHAKRQIPANRQVMVIPQNFLLTLEKAKQTEIGLKLEKAELSARKHCYLSILVLIDRKDAQSFFQPYYRTLPRSYSNMPIFWNENDLELLEGSHILSQIEDRKRNIRADYDEICRVAPEFSEFSIREFSWARMVVASRNFTVNVHGVQTDALVPFADMLNHLRPRETKWEFEDEQDAFTITSLDEIPAGRQVYDSYGKKCNSRFLLNYGFAVENNTDEDGTCHNEVHLLVCMDPSDDLFGRKVELLGEDEDHEIDVRISTSFDAKNTAEAFSYARLRFATAEEMTGLPSFEGEYDLCETPIHPISRANEAAALAYLAGLCRARLAAYPTALQEDNDALKSGELEVYSNERNARILVRGEKEVCQHYIMLAEMAIPCLDLEWRDYRKILLKNHRDLRRPASRYMLEVVGNLVKKTRCFGNVPLELRSSCEKHSSINNSIGPPIPPSL